MQQHRTWNNFGFSIQAEPSSCGTWIPIPIARLRGCPWRLSNSEMPERVPRALLSASPFDPSFPPSHPPPSCFFAPEQNFRRASHPHSSTQAPCAGLVSNRPPLHACMRRLASSPEPSGLRGAVLPSTLASNLPSCSVSLPPIRTYSWTCQERTQACGSLAYSLCSSLARLGRLTVVGPCWDRGRCTPSCPFEGIIVWEQARPRKWIDRCARSSCHCGRHKRSKLFPLRLDRGQKINTTIPKEVPIACHRYSTTRHLWSLARWNETADAIKGSG